MENLNKIKKAQEIAKKSLRKCYFGEGILASRNHFSDFWARDSFWAMSGILAIGDFKKAKNIFELFLKYQRKDGKIPRKIMREYTLLKYLFKIKIKRKKLKPVYVGLIPPFHSMDDNSLLVIAFWKYIEKTKDKKFAQKYYQQIKRAINWYDKKLSSNLIKEYFLSNWSDSIFRNGKVLYTNTLYYEASKSFSKLARFVEEQGDEEFYFKKSKKVKEKIDIEFWNGKFYKNQPKDKKHFEVVSNVLVSLYRIASKNKKETIITKLVRVKTGKLLPTVFPKYSFWKINPITYLFGISDYHNGASWLWIDLLAIKLEYENGNKNLALINLKKVSEIILRDRIIYETYCNDGKMYGNQFWKSAVPFAWNSGIFLEVVENIYCSKS